MELNKTLLSLPYLVWSHIASSLDIQDLLSLSATCSTVRAILNHDNIWHKYTHERRALESTPCRVQPEFTVPAGDTLVPLCRGRVHLLRQKRLENNFTQGTSVKKSLDIDLDAHRSEFPYSLAVYQQMKNIFKDVYYFCTEQIEGDNNVVHVFNIEGDPFLETSFPIPNTKNKNCNYYGIHVFGSKLVILSNEKLMDVFQINLPDMTFQHLHSIHVIPRNSYVIGHFVMVESPDYSHYQLWDLDTGIRLSDIRPSDGRSRIELILEPKDSKRALFCVGPTSSHSVHCFDFVSKAFTSFNSASSISAEQTRQMRQVYSLVWSLLDDHHVVLFYTLGNRMTYVFVYDYTTSQLLAGKQLHLSHGVTDGNHSNILNNILIVPFTCTYKIVMFNIKTIEVLRQIELSKVNIHSVQYLNFPLRHFVVVTREQYIDVWDLEQGKRVANMEIDLHVVKSDVNESGSKIVVRSSVYGYPKTYLNVFSFW